jgi:hypothetical protein
VTNDLKHASVKAAQGSVYKMLTWTKKSSKRRQEWEKVCVESSLWPCTFQTPMTMRFASKVIMFEEALKFKKP